MNDFKHVIIEQLDNVSWTNNKEKIDYFKEFGFKIKKHRKIQGISQCELAMLCGVSQTKISNIERGKQNANLNTVFKIFEGLNITFDIKEREDFYGKE